MLGPVSSDMLSVRAKGMQCPWVAGFIHGTCGTLGEATSGLCLHICISTGFQDSG